MKKNWDEYVAVILKYIFIIVFLGGFGFLIFYCLTTNDGGAIPQEVEYITDWQYQIEGQNQWKDTQIPCKLEEAETGQQVRFRATLPDDINDNIWLATLNSRDIVVQIDGKVRLSWNRDDVTIPGGIAKSAFMYIELTSEDAGKEIVLIKHSKMFNGGMTDVIIGDSLSLVNELKRTRGNLQFIVAFFIFIMSAILVVIGIFLRRIYNQRIYLISVSLGVMAASAWLIMNSNMFQVIFGHRYIDGVLSYILTLIMVFPFVSYIDSMQKFRYRKIYAILGLIELANFAICSFLHFSGIANFSVLLQILDFVIASIAFIVIVCTIMDIMHGKAKGYSLVAIAIVTFMILCVIEIFVLNTAGDRVDGIFILIGLIILLALAVAQQVVDIEENQNMLKASEEANRAKSEFLANMSHELRTPINAILGMNEMILQDNESPKIQRYAERIGESGKLLIDLVDDAIDYSLYAAGEDKIIKANYRLRDVIDEILTMLKEGVGTRNIKIKTSIDIDIPEKLRGDERHIKKILSNLASNAIKYTQEGSITLGVECPRTRDGYMLCVYIKDTGKGIRQEDLGRIFSPFVRADIQNNRSIEGTGLGLAITKELVDRMKGTISVESVYGAGSTFMVKIPQRPARQNPEDIEFIRNEKKSSVITGVSGRQKDSNIDNEQNVEEQLTEKTNLDYSSQDYSEEETETSTGAFDDFDKISISYIAPKARVLAVDDNNANLIVIRELLRKTEIDLELVSSGQEAIEICKRVKYDLILMDHMMPSPDGVESLKEIRSGIEGLNRKTPQIVVTANAVGNCQEQYLKEGFDDYLSKPIDRVRLLKMIRKYLKPSLIIEVEEEVNTSSTDVEEVADNMENMDNSIIDFEALGKRFNNQAKTINMVLSECVREGDKKLVLLPKLFEDGDIARYAVEAHGVKGVMASICANDISARAKQHEFAGKEQRVDFIKEDIAGFVEQYRQVIEYIAEYLQNQGVEVKRAASVPVAADGTESVASLVEQVNDALDDFDADKAINIIDKLLGVVEADKKSFVEEAKDYADDFQYDMAKESLAKIL